MDKWLLCKMQAERRGLFHDPLVFELLLDLNTRLTDLERENVVISSITDQLSKSANNLSNALKK